ncbi:MAG: hypothetical protein K8S27_06340 [Candidatus Omnitrophica bacterium]|nr:hypothetical protein [Candidatus Omnitrophota bacterium]
MPQINRKDIWTLCFLFSLIVFVVILYLLFKGQQTIYYSPVFNSQGKSVAYIKRMVDYQVEGGSLIPFMGEQVTISVKSDRLQLCQKDLESNKETVIHDWMIDLDQRNKLGGVWVRLDWHGPVLKYYVRLTDYGQIHLGQEKNGPSGLEWILTNTRERELIKHGPIEVGVVQVFLNADPEKIRFPYVNRLIIEKR